MSIIGASAAGLATAACLKESGQAFEILEASDVVGLSWRHHYDRLHLHTPKSASSLPGLSMPAQWPRYPTRDQVVDYLERYRVHHGLEPHFGQKVTRLERRDDEWVATTGDDHRSTLGQPWGHRGIRGVTHIMNGIGTPGYQALDRATPVNSCKCTPSATTRRRRAAGSVADPPRS